MNNPISENELIALIKKYSFFYENELNKFNVIKNESHNTYKFNYNKDFQHECNIILNQYILNIKKYTPLLLVEQKLYQELVNTVNKYNKLNLSKYEFETLFSLIQIKSVLLSFGIDENAPLFSFWLLTIISSKIMVKSNEIQ